MAIYTRTGDDGTTAIFGGRRISKANTQIDILGTIDELSSFLGLVSSFIQKEKEKEFLISIQKDLYEIMSFISGGINNLLILKNRIKEFEISIDLEEKKLPKINHFIIPGGSKISSWLHILRTTTRKTERRMVSYYETEKKEDILLTIKYLNRLSDLFFVLARKHGQDKEIIL